LRIVALMPPPNDEVAVPDTCNCVVEATVAAKYDVVAFVDEKSATFKSVDEAVDVNPLYREARPEIAAVPDAKRPPDDVSVVPVMAVPLIACAERVPEIVVDAPFRIAGPEM
jgi:hypothetical protein